MKSTSELTDFYYNDLYASLQGLEAERRAVKKRVIYLYAILTGIVLVISGLIYRDCHCFDGTYFIAIVIAAGIGGFIQNMLVRPYRNGFKEKIIRPLIHAIDPNLRFAPDAVIPRSLFEFSDLFAQRIDRFEGNDLVRGTVHGIALQFSDVHAQQRHRNAKGREEWSTIFRGQFIVADFNKHFKGRTLVLPDTAEKIFGTLVGGMLQKRVWGKDRLVKMDDPAFEKAFVVYGTDQIEARYILTHAMMARLLKLKQQAGAGLYVAFKGEKIMIAIAHDRDLFEPTLFASLLSVRQARDHINTLKSSIGIVEELKLNEHLWSKMYPKSN